jgi:hypothetical protein
METEPVPQQSQHSQEMNPPPVVAAAEPNVVKVFGACVAAALVPGLGHALLKKWDRAIVFLLSIVLLFALGIQLQARLFSPDFSDLFSILKFIADAGSGLLYWLPWIRGIGVGDPSAYTYDFGNVFIYAAGLLNMLVVVDAFDIAMGRKQ